MQGNLKIMSLGVEGVVPPQKASAIQALELVVPEIEEAVPIKIENGSEAAATVLKKQETPLKPDTKQAISNLKKKEKK